MHPQHGGQSVAGEGSDWDGKEFVINGAMIELPFMNCYYDLILKFENTQLYETFSSNNSPPGVDLDVDPNQRGCPGKKWDPVDARPVGETRCRHSECL